MSGRWIETALARAEAGAIEAAPRDAHLLTVHAAGRIQASFACEDLRLRRLLVPGDIDLIPASAAARLVDEGPNAVLVLALAPHRVAAQADELRRDARRLRPLAGVRDPMIADLAWRLHARRDRAPHLYDDCLGEALIGRLLRRHDPAVDDHPAARIGALAGARLRRVLDLIEGELADRLSIDRLSAEARLGPTAFKIAFRKALGAPVHAYVVRRRAERARLLLLEGRLPASQVALEAGFSHQTHMARWLKRLFGVLPSEIDPPGGAELPAPRAAQHRSPPP